MINEILIKYILEKNIWLNPSLKLDFFVDIINVRIYSS